MLFPATVNPRFCEKYVLKNLGIEKHVVVIPAVSFLYQTEPTLGVDGSYTISVLSENNGVFNLAEGDSIVFGCSFNAEMT